MPWLYLKGVSTGQFEEALAALLGTDAPGLSATTVRRLTEVWQEEHERWQGRDLSSRRYVYLWADGIYFTPRLEHERQCMLVLIGADAQGRKELLAIEDGYRESAQSWRELLLRLRDENGLKLDPKLATGDGALGFWQALHEVWPKTRQQRCWVHKVANVLNKLPPSLQGKAKQDLHRIYEAANRREAEDAFDRFLAKYGSKYDKAVSCLAKDREALLTFYDFPAEHWKHIRTSNPIESTFATVRLRTSKTKGCLSRKTALAMVFKLAKSAERHWRRLDGSERLAQVIEGVRFRDGEPFKLPRSKLPPDPVRRRPSAPISRQHWKHIRTSQSDREHLRDRPATHQQDQRLPVGARLRSPWSSSLPSRPSGTGVGWR